MAVVELSVIESVFGEILTAHIINKVGYAATSWAAARGQVIRSALESHLGVIIGQDEREGERQ